VSGTVVVPTVNAVAIVLCVAFLAYVVAILLPFLRQPPAVPGRATDLTWHLLVPCLDEAAVIGRTVTRLLATAPTAHVWCVDDASTDATPDVLAVLAATHDRVHVVSRRAPHARQGKGAALNAGYLAVLEHQRLLAPGDDPRAVVVGVVDADGRLDPHALDVLAGPTVFGDPAVGAAQVQVRMLNRGLAGRVDADDPAPATRRGRALVALQDLEFRTVISAMQLLRQRLGSVGMGGNGQFTRLSVLGEIAAEHGVPWRGALLEDFELGLHVLLAGHRNQYCDDTWVAQEALPGVSALVRQRTRWAQGGMQCAKYLPAVLGSTRISTAAALEIAYFLLIPWTQLLGSVVYTGALSIMGWYAVTTPGGVAEWFAGGGWGVVALAVIFGVGPVSLWGPVYRRACEPGTSRRRALGLGLLHWLYTYVLLVAVWKAFVRVLRSERGWVKTSRVLDAPVLPVAEVLPAAPVPAAAPVPTALVPAGPVPAAAGPSPAAPTPGPVPTPLRPSHHPVRRLTYRGVHRASRPRRAA
jgi:cellulose synthase/poly-beta-1,6-N-acetylglucosamine synthase-like glycosyltransferase